ncbi:MAG TPA: long-chain-fatty-acid--CoA ligase [Burkholderiaceae bacterium]|nr:long-chain-fatty-acid--CoA ligase [Burkholderiaceae bacterium]
MLGQMMKVPLTIPSLLEFAARYHGDSEVVSKTVEGPIHRYSYAQLTRRAKQLANALRGLGLGEGDIVGTLAWNGYRHMELYYGVSGIGAICHTINPRLFVDQISYIINHAEDRYVFTDLTFVKLLEGMAEKLKKVRGFVVMTDRAGMPSTTLPNVLCYEELLAGQPETFEWRIVDENSAAGLCYTSGTTGNPRGVLYSHRSTVLHSMAVLFADAFALTARDAILPVVPMFHVNAWGIPHAAPISGCKLVMPGPHLDGPSLTSLMETEGVTISAGVPTVWLGLLTHIKEVGKSPSRLNRVVIGGSACPAAMMEAFENLGVRVIHAWGMTEMSPLGVINSPTRRSEAMSPSERAAITLKQGRPLFGIDAKIVDATGKELPFDGTTFGSLKVRGYWVCDGYFRQEPVAAHSEPGWFDTGDVATIDVDGFVKIVDRTKDVIKSGGEWISSIELENIAVAHPAVREAAAIARPDEKWGERPVIVAVLKPGAAATADEIRAFYRGKVSKWCEPDAVIIVESLPHTATGKLLKTELRRLYG